MVSIPIAVSKEAVVFAEILAVASTMRKNSRWASSSGHSYPVRGLSIANPLKLRRGTVSLDPSSSSGKYEAELMMGFLDLKRQVRDIEDIERLPLSSLFSPFLSLIRSPLSTGPITSAALSAIHNFFATGLVTPKSLGLEAALSELSNAVSHCKFEASDASGDEVVLYRIMAVIRECMCGSVGNKLSDIEVCEMLETVLTTCCQMRLSEILRRYAESTMHALVRQVFYRLHSLDASREEEKLRDAIEDKRENEIRVDLQMPSNSNSSSVDTGSSQTVVVPEQENASPESQAGVVVKNDKIITSEVSSLVIPSREEYGLPSVLELLRVLINILDPNDRLHTDSTRLTALGILNAALETCGSRIGDYLSLANLILDHGCKHLFQLARSDNSTVLCLAMRVISTIFDVMRNHLKLQRELFFVFMIDRLDMGTQTKSLSSSQTKKDVIQSPRPGTSGTTTSSEKEKEVNGRPRPGVLAARGEIRELMLETLSHIARHPSFMVDLYTNYDCDVNCEDLFEKLIDLLAKGIYPSQSSHSPESQQASQLLCLDTLLEFIKHMSSRAEGNSQPWPQNFPTSKDLLGSKSRKRLVLVGAQKFNAKPKLGLSFLEENNLIYSDLSKDVDRPKSLAKFLKSCTRIDKRLLGEYISRPENTELLKAFIGLFNFSNKPVSDAMREMLESFRLPGEAQPIARIAETFAEHYFNSGGSNDVKSQDSVYVLAYSVLMLNTDLHNPQNRKRMTVEDYQRNLRGTHEGGDFAPEYLQTIYDSIKKREIIMPEEHTGRLGFEYAWKELLIRSQSAGSFLSCNSNLFDMVMFKAVWKSVISSITFAFTTFDDDYIVQRAIAGFRQCATLAGRFHMPDVFDYVVVSLSQVTGLLPNNLISNVPSYPVIKVEGQDVTISTLSVNFGTNFKGQLAAVVLFTIVNGNGSAIREGWTQIFEVFLNLFLHSLLPVEMLQMEDFLGGNTPISLQSNQPRSNLTPRGEGGLLSALSSYLLTPYGSSSEALVPEATDVEIENTLTSLDCIAACRLAELYGQVSQLNAEAVIAAMRALEALAYERTVARLKQDSDDYSAANPNNSSKVNSHVLSYDPASIYLLETMVSIAAKTLLRIEEVWPIVFEHLSALFSYASQFSMLLIERAVVGLLRLCSILAEKTSSRDQFYVSLDLLGSLPPTVVASVGEQITAGLSRTIKSHKDIIRSHTEWGLVFALMRNSAANPGAAKQSFEILLSLILDGPEQCITQDNIHGLINLLDFYASAVTIVLDSLSPESRRDTRRLHQESTVERGRKAVELLFDFRKFIPAFIQEAKVPKIEAWREYSLPLVASLGRQCSNTSREIRHNALINLQRLLLSQQILMEEDMHIQIEDIFNRVIFPLVDDLLDPEISQRDPQGMPETRLRASALLCKSFMQFAIRDDVKTDVNLLWKQTLDLLDRLMNVDKHDPLSEAVPESLKNVLLVMNASGLLKPPSNTDRSENQVSLWNFTSERIGEFLPGFLETVFPTPKSEAS